MGKLLLQGLEQEGANGSDGMEEEQIPIHQPGLTADPASKQEVGKQHMQTHTRAHDITFFSRCLDNTSSVT